MITTIDQINGVQVRDYSRDGRGMPWCVAACVDCGKEREVRVGSLKAGRCKRCRSCAQTINGESRKTHGMYRKPVHKVWHHMLQRCSNPRDTAYKNYDGRGIVVCDEWKDASTFITWALAHGYSEDLQLDRIDNDGDYTPGNCRFTTKEVQMRNTRRLKSTNVSGYRGVSRSKKRWRTSICVDRKKIHLGRFDTAIEAAHVYDAYVIEHDLEHTLNFRRST